MVFDRLNSGIMSSDFPRHRCGHIEPYEICEGFPLPPPRNNLEFEQDRDTNPKWGQMMIQLCSLITPSNHLCDQSGISFFTMSLKKHWYIHFYTHSEVYEST